jgi:hypothetical protein
MPSFNEKILEEFIDATNLDVLVPLPRSRDQRTEMRTSEIEFLRAKIQSDFYKADSK